MKVCAERAVALLCVATLALSWAGTAGAAGDGTAESPYEIPEVAGRVSVDGLLDENVWDQALRLELAYETSPGDNIPASVSTQLLLATSSTHLYAAFIAEDPDLSKVCANITDRDNMFDDDRVSLIIDTFNDQRRSYMFFANPFGIQGDALDSHGYGAGDAAWDTIWDSDGRLTPEGWVVEMAIPFSSIRFQGTEGRQVWGIGAGRKYSRDVDYRYSLTPRDLNESCYLCQIAKARGFEGATPGRNIELDPTFSTSTTWRRGEDGFDSGDTENDPGLTARWGVTPNLVISGTANPDFAQVEADAIQLEANEQFALFYEEKRPFFLEGMEHFRMMLNPVYTRTIADPNWGLKMTGKEGSNALGAFVVRDEITNILLPGSRRSGPALLDQPVTDAAVRYRMDLASASSAGFVLTARDGDGYRNLVGGGDAILRLTPSDRLEMQVLQSRTDYPDSFAVDKGLALDEFEGMAYDFEYNHSGETFDWWGAYRQIGDDFRADMGYRPRIGFRQMRGGWSYVRRAEAGHWYTQLNSGFGYVHNDELEGGKLENFFDFWMNYNGPMRSEFNVYGMIGRESWENENDEFDKRFFDKRIIDANVGLWPTGTMLTRLGATFGDDVDRRNGRQATRLTLEPMVYLNLARRLNVVASHEYERLDISEGRLYTANITYLRTAYQFTRRMFLRAILQHVDYVYETEHYTEARDSRFRHFASQVLFSYKINPQTVLYLGYSDSHLGDDETDLEQQDRTFFAKIGYAWVL
jgi:hypothetical protein